MVTFFPPTKRTVRLTTVWMVCPKVNAAFGIGVMLEQGGPNCQARILEVCALVLNYR
jgi:hypothetical protein